jgi:hypothetical protein
VSSSVPPLLVLYIYVYKIIEYKRKVMNKDL